MTTLSLRTLCIGSALLWVACDGGTLPAADGGRDGGTIGVDSGTPRDSGTSDEDAGTDGGGPFDCTGEDDGTVCDEGFICLADVCSPSVCGDGFIDATRAEQCEDGNEEPNDGCQPGSCTFTCEADAACADTATCNGSETCDLTAHLCQPGTNLPNGDACTLDTGEAGECNAGACVMAGCGNGVTSSSEECDDGNAVDGDGCNTDCTFSCEADADCADGDTCNGDEACDVATHTCTAGTPLDCADASDCTTDACDPVAGCSHTLIDVDGDGHAPTSLGACGTDCNDTSSAVYPGAPEYCETIDNDCDGDVDEGATMATCYPDGDADAYPRSTGATMACVCPAGTIPRRADGVNDCADHVASAYPGQTRYFPSGYRATTSPISRLTFDYNCDGTNTQRWPEVAPINGCARFLSGCIGTGWTGSTVPACGIAAPFRNCTPNSVGSCDSTTANRTQECR